MRFVLSHSFLSDSVRCGASQEGSHHLACQRIKHLGMFNISVRTDCKICGEKPLWLRKKLSLLHPDHKRIQRPKGNLARGLWIRTPVRFLGSNRRLKLGCHERPHQADLLNIRCDEHSVVAAQCQFLGETFGADRCVVVKFESPIRLYSAFEERVDDPTIETYKLIAGGSNTEAVRSGEFGNLDTSALLAAILQGINFSKLCRRMDSPL